MSKAEPKPPIPKTAFLSTGSTLLNLACSGRTGGGLFKGGYLFLVGDSASGKTWWSLTCMAEASINPNFDDYRFIFDNAENGALMEVRRYFGNQMADRMEPPAGDRENPEYSTTLEEFFYHIDTALDDKRPCIYVLDSMDALNPEEVNENFEAKKQKHLTGKGKAKGSMGMEKGKLNSQNFGRIIPKLEKSGSILIVISQTRDKVGFGAKPGEKTRSGGYALRFYAHHEIWTKKVYTRRKRVNGRDRKVGGTIRLTLTEKNRVNGWLGDVFVPIYRQTGIDDLGGCVEYLMQEKHWKKPAEKKVKTGEEEDKGKPPEKVIAPEFDYEGPIEGLIEKIEAEGREKELRSIVRSVWFDTEEALKITRKNRYT